MKYILYPLAVVPVFLITLLLLATYGDEAAEEFIAGIKSFFDAL